MNFLAIHPPPNMIYYHYASTRAAQVPLTLFANFEGYFQTDLYCGYNEVFLPNKVTRLGCMAHVRRKLVDAQAVKHGGANKLIKLIAELYKIEKAAKNASPEKRLAMRQKSSKELLQRLFDTADTVQLGMLPQHPLHGAIEYLRK